MNPVIVIPSYWSRNDALSQVGDVGIYDHATPISKPLPELETCLQSLEQVRGVLRVVVLVVSPPAFAESARARVDGICRMHLIKDRCRVILEGAAAQALSSFQLAGMQLLQPENFRS